jgi:hypothetical protein
MSASLSSLTCNGWKGLTFKSRFMWSIMVDLGMPSSADLFRVDFTGDCVTNAATAWHLPKHGTEFNCATTMKVSIPIFWTLTPSDKCPYQTLNHNRYSVENKEGGYTHFSATLYIQWTAASAITSILDEGGRDCLQNTGSLLHTNCPKRLHYTQTYDSRLKLCNTVKSTDNM